MWNAQNHCQHSAALFLFYVLSEVDIESLGQFNDGSNPEQDLVPPQYQGKMVKGADKLQGSNSRYYEKLKYQTLDGQIKDFTLGELASAQIVFNLVPIKGIETNNKKTEMYEVNFSLQKGNKLISEISLFETKFIFNWQDAFAYEVPEKIAVFIKAMAENRFLTSVFAIHSFCKENKQANFLIDGQAPDQAIPILRPTMVINLNQLSNSHKLTVHFLDEKDQKVSVPLIYKTLINMGGELENFTSKIELARFIELFFQDNPEYENFTFTHKDKDNFLNILKGIRAQDFLISSNQDFEIFKIPEAISPKNLLTIVWNFFGEKSLVDSIIVNENGVQSLQFRLETQKVDQNLFKFFEALTEKEIPLYFEDKKVTSWQKKSSMKRNFSAENWFEIDIELNDKELTLLKNLDPKEKKIFDGDNLVLLSETDGQYLSLLKKYLRESVQTKEEKSQDTNHLTLRLNRCRLFDIYSLYQASGLELLTQEEKDICEKLLNLENLPKYDYPTTIKFEPREYQQKGYQWIRLLYDLRLGSCLADDMGLGKTFQTISFLESIKESDGKVLIACPVSILINWQDEFHKFSTMRPHLYYGQDRYFDPEAKVIITSYGLLRKEVDTLFSQHKWDVFVMDEVQKLKNSKSLGAQAARKLPVRFRLCLTGTPVENDLSEFYNIIDLAVPGVWGNTRELNYMKKNRDSRFIARSIAKPFILRRTKKEVLKDLPEKLEQTVLLSFEGEQKVMYYKAIDEIRKRMENPSSKHQLGQILKDLLQLRQLCLWQESNSGIQSTKIDFLLDNLEQVVEGGHQALIYSQFTKYLDIIQTHIKARNWKFSRIDGSYTLKKRQKEIESFQSGENKLFLISLKAGGLGLNLTQANYIFIMDPWWNPAVENQAIDRAYRIGQTKNITVYRPIIRDSVEEKVLKLQERKKELFTDLMEERDGDGFSGKLTLEDFKAILG
jgi:SNF2 family DNA or RNA helicase